MNGARAKALRTDERPRPGRKHGGVNPWPVSPVSPRDDTHDRELQWQKRRAS